MPTDKRNRQREARLARLEAERKAAKKANQRKRLITGVVIAAVVFAALLLISQLGGDDDEEDVAADGTTVASTPDSTDTSETTVAPVTTEVPREDKPEVEVPGGDPPTELVIDDLEPGDGTEATAGSTLLVDYVGVSASTGEEFDASFGGGSPLEFVLGAGRVIQGWDQGLEGMKVGGRRRLVIPAALAYGPTGSPPSIGPDETLVFVIDLLGVGPSGGE